MNGLQIEDGKLVKTQVIPGFYMLHKRQLVGRFIVLIKPQFDKYLTIRGVRADIVVMYGGFLTICKHHPGFVNSQVDPFTVYSANA